MTLDDLANETLVLESKLRALRNTNLSQEDAIRLTAARELQRLTVDRKVLGIKIIRGLAASNNIPELQLAKNLWEFAELMNK